MTKQVKCGDVIIGGGAPISIQSMTNVDSRDEDAVKTQIRELEDAGVDIIRIAVPDEESVEVFGKVKNFAKVPLVADIHFDYKLAIKVIEKGADKVRINPGNIGDTERVKAVVEAAKKRNVPIRVGVNSGSLEKDILEKFNGKVTPEGLAESAIRNLELIEKLGYDNLVVSLKSSDVAMNYNAHKIVAARTDHPIHIGITEAGTLEKGKVKSAAGLGALLLNGIGDTMRVSLTANPVEEVYFAKELLKSLGIRKSGIEYVSCPTCGRTKINLEKLAREIETKLEPIDKKLTEQNKHIKVAIMGCVVNGPGESKEADFGVAGGDGKAIIFKKGQIVKTVEEGHIVEELFNEINNY